MFRHLINRPRLANSPSTSHGADPGSQLTDLLDDNLQAFSASASAPGIRLDAIRVIVSGSGLWPLSSLLPSFGPCAGDTLVLLSQRPANLHREGARGAAPNIRRSPYSAGETFRTRNPCVVFSVHHSPSGWTLVEVRKTAGDQEYPTVPSVGGGKAGRRFQKSAMSPSARSFAEGPARSRLRSAVQCSILNRTSSTLFEASPAFRSRNPPLVKL
ncbi:unnamed protein product [Diplocarpon coronariae]|nr:hypothetical protein JHW43_007341 [Diplocarpon mali]